MSKGTDQPVTFEALGVHPVVVAALAEKGLNHAQELQRKTLQHTVHDFADIIAEAPPHSGRHTLLSILSAHCVLSSDNPARSSVVIVANSNSTSSKIFNMISTTLASTRVTPVACLEDRPPRGLPSPGGLVYLGTLATLSKWAPESFHNTVTLVVEDCSIHDVRSLQSVIETIISASPSANLFFLSSVAPSNVDLSIRYLLRRKNRRYYFHENAAPSFTYLMCHDADDRAQLNLKISQLAGFKSILILTHNREVRDLKAALHQALGVKTFSIQRNTSSADHDRVLSDFLRSQYAVLVAMDAYTGVDLMDLDAVIQYYPPQKSMPEEEWAEYVSYLHTTSAPRRSTVITTIVAPDDFSLVSYFMRRVGAEGPVVNISPNHPQFHQAVLSPQVLALEKMKLDNGHHLTSGGATATSPTTVSPPSIPHIRDSQPQQTTSVRPQEPVQSLQARRQEQQQQQQQRKERTGEEEKSLPVPRSLRNDGGSLPIVFAASAQQQQQQQQQQRREEESKRHDRRGGAANNNAGSNNNSNNNGQQQQQQAERKSPGMVNSGSSGSYGGGKVAAKSDKQQQDNVSGRKQQQQQQQQQGKDSPAVTAASQPDAPKEKTPTEQNPSANKGDGGGGSNGNRRRRR